MATRTTKTTKRLADLLVKLMDDEPDECSAALSKLTFLGPDALLLLVGALNHRLADVRATARSYLAPMLTTFVTPKLRQALESTHQEVRLEALRQIVRLIPDVQAGIAARRVGWEVLTLLTAPPPGGQTPVTMGCMDAPSTGEQLTSVTEDSMDQAEENRTFQGVAEDKHQDFAATRQPRQWNPDLFSYPERRILRFTTPQDLESAIDLLWSEELRTLPHDTPDGKSIVVPAEAVDYFVQAGLKFTDKRLRSITELSQEEVRNLRR